MNNSTQINALLDIIDNNQEPLTVFAALLPILGQTLKCHRVFLYIRNPDTKIGKVINCWRCSNEIPNILDSAWKKEPESLTSEDPMFAAAVRAEPSIYIEDVKTASRDVLNQEFENREFGHQALIHVHLREQNQLWGILQPCLFGSTRVWSTHDRDIITQVEQKLTPLVINYVKQYFKNCESHHI
jgi:GAF domain-containing protein